MNIISSSTSGGVRPRLTKTYQDLPKLTKTYQDLPRLTKTYQDLPPSSRYFTPLSLSLCWSHYRSNLTGGRPGCQLPPPIVRQPPNTNYWPIFILRCSHILAECQPKLERWWWIHWRPKSFVRLNSNFKFWSSFACLAVLMNFVLA